MKKLLLIVCLVQACLVLISSDAMAQGISVDAGLTPAENRWVIRTMVHFMQRDADPTSMNRSMQKNTFNTMVAYGLKRNLTLMLKQPILFQEMSMAGNLNKNSGLGDMSLMVKYGMYRINTYDYSFGIATTLGLKLPTGDDRFSDGTIDLKPGVYMSIRADRWASDFAVAYDWKGFDGENNKGINPGNELSLDWALAYKFSIGKSGNLVWAPVIEISYKSIDPNRMASLDMVNTGESVLLISPGLKLTKSSFTIEALTQIPVNQKQTGLQLERGIAFMVGTRYMF